MAVTIGTGEIHRTRRLVRTSTGKLYAVLSDGTKVEVWYGGTDGSSWVQKDAGNSPDCMSLSPVAVAIDSGDILHIVYYHDDYPSSGGLDYITFDTVDGGEQDDAFNTEEEAMDQTDADNTKYGCAISIDANDKPHAVFVDSDAAKGTDYDTIYYANKIGVNWSSLKGLEVEGVSIPVDCDYPDITIDADNKPCVTYYQSTNNDYKAAIGDANDATTFTPQLISEPGIAMFFQTPSIAVDSSGNHHIAYLWGTGDSYPPDPEAELRIRKHNYGDAWGTWQAEETVDANFITDYLSTDTGPSLVINGTDRYILVEDDDDNINYYYDTGSGWTDGGDLETGTYSRARAKWAFWVDNDSGGPLLESFEESLERITYYNVVGGDGVSTNEAQGQSFKAISSHQLDFVVFGIFKLGNPTDNLYIEIASTITGATIATSDTINGSDITTTGYPGQLHSFVFSSPPSLTSNNTYYFRVLRSGAYDISNYYRIIGSGGAQSDYVDGTRYVKNNGNWSGTTYDLTFKVYTTRSVASEIDYLFKSGTDVYWNKLDLAVGADHTKDLTETLSVSESFKKATQVTKSDALGISELLSLLSAFVKAPSESLTLTESSLKGVETIQTDILSLGETVTAVKVTLQNLSDSLAIIESHKKAITSVLSDDLSLTESIQTAKTFVREVSESITLAETLKKELKITKSESFAIVESLATVLAANRSFTEALTLSETLVLTSTFEKSLAEILVLSELIKKSERVNLTESLSLIESISKVLGTELSLIDSFALAEIIKRDSDLNLSDSIVFIESSLKDSGLMLTETESFSESISTLSEYKKILSDSEALSELINFSPTTTLQDVISFTESSLKNVGKILTDDITLTHLTAPYKKISLAASASLALSDAISSGQFSIQSDTLNLSEAIAKNIGVIKTESLVISDIVSAITTFQKTLTDLLLLAEDFKKFSVLTLTDALALSEIIDTVKTQLKKLTDSVVLNDVFSSLTGYLRSLTSILSFADNLTKLSDLSLSESLSLIEELIFPAKLQELSDSFTLLDSFVASTEKSLSDSLSLIENLKQAFNVVKTDNISLIEALALQSDTEFAQVETLTLSENLKKTFRKENIESLVFSDVVKKISGQQLTDTLVLSDIVITKSEFEQALSESISLIESLTKTTSLVRSEVISLIETSARIFTSERIFTETLTLAESISLTSIFIKILTDILTLTESLQKLDEISFSDSLSLIEDIQTYTGSEKNLQDILSLTELLSKETSLTLSESINLIESLIQGMLLSRTETVSLIEVFTKDIGIVKIDDLILSETFNRTFTFQNIDSIVFADAFRKITGKKLSEDLDLNEIRIATTTFVSVLIETLQLTEILQKNVGLTFDDSVDLLDSISTKTISKKEFAETISFSDAIDLVSSFSKEFVDTFTLVETFQKISGASLSDSLNFVESLQRYTGSEKDIQDNLNLAEIFSKTIELSKSDNFSLIKTVLSSSVKTLTDNLTLSEVIITTSEFINSLTDTLNLNDVLFRALELKKDDSLIFSDSFLKELELQKIESFNLLDSIATTIVVKRNLFESLSLNESLMLPRQQILADLLSINEIIKKQFQIPKGETLVLIESLQTVADQKISLIEGLQFRENFIKLTETEVRLVDDFALVDFLIKEIGFTLQDSFNFIDSLSFLEKETSPRRKTFLLTKDQKAISITKGQKTYLFSKHVNPTTD